MPSTITRVTSHPPRSIPKLGPASAASATTVNVEFSGTGRSVTSTFSSQPLTKSDPLRHCFRYDEYLLVRLEALQPPQRGLRKVLSFRKIKSMSTASVGRMNAKGCYIDRSASEDIGEESDIVPLLLGRMLRRRGLSNSTIHSTFSSQADAPLSPHAPTSDLHHLQITCLA